MANEFTDDDDALLRQQETHYNRTVEKIIYLLSDNIIYTYLGGGFASSQKASMKSAGSGKFVNSLRFSYKWNPTNISNQSSQTV